MKLIVIDDERTTANTIAKLAAEGAGKATNTPESIHEDELLQFFRRIEEARDKKRMIEDFGDDAIILVDYDLQELSKKNDGVLVPNGRELAWMIRRYVRCGSIIAVNEPPARMFPLTIAYEPVSPACIHLRQEDLATPWLWGNPATGYAPWHWPDVVARSKSFGNRRDELKHQWKVPIGDILELPASARPLLPLIERLGNDLHAMTPEEVAKAIVPPKEHAHVTPDGLAAVVESIVTNWLHYNVLWRQEVATDAPHLVASLPFLLQGAGPTLADRRQKHPALSVPVESRYEAPETWFDRPVWWHSSLRNDKVVLRAKAQAKLTWDDQVFLEDRSTWVKSSDARRYECEGFFPTRYLAKTPPAGDVTYSPKARVED